VQGSDGNFYGTTGYGGTNNDGTVFRVSPSGSYTSLHSFIGRPSDGATPYAGPVQGRDGNFYGTTQEGGASGDGTVFRIGPGGTYTTLYSFVGSPTDGASPYAGLVQGPDGNFYGTTGYGGTKGHGTVFRISPGGTIKVLYSFAGSPTDGGAPNGLVQGSDGNFYGTTSEGGTSTNCVFGCGTVFRINPSGTYANLYSFTGYPFDGLVQGSDGNFYGTTYEGGTHNLGTVFRISPGGTYSNLYSFVGSPTDGANPTAGLVQGSDGNFYGTTGYGGTRGNGTVFRISPDGGCSNLYSFVGMAAPYAGLVQGPDGNFYGTTQAGGTTDNGTVFKLTVPLSPPANQVSAAQIVDNDVTFSIPSVAGETYQLQFSSSMSPTNWINVASVSVTNSIGALLTVTNFGGVVGPQGFYRFAITP
jgi:uncharacterized repeat protein (TIGR03803 family)